MMNNSSAAVRKLYQSVIDEVIESMRDAVLEEGIDEQVLTELKQLWEQKLKATKALDTEPTPTHLALPPNKRVTAMPAASSVPQQISMIQATSTQIVRPTAVHSHQTQPLDMSGAAATATMALPHQMQQQVLAGTIQLHPNGVGGLTALLPNNLQAGQITIQPQQIQQIQPQNLSTKVQGQLDGTDDHPFTSQLNFQKTEDDSCRPKTTVPCHKKKSKEIEVVIQLDGNDSSSDEDDDIDDDDDDDVDNEGGGEGEEEEPLNSEDDDEDGEDSSALFEMENVVVCQYDKITRSKNRWRFTLKDGIMNINQKDYVFQRASGEAEW